MNRRAILTAGTLSLVAITVSLMWLPTVQNIGNERSRLAASSLSEVHLLSDMA